jgi:hypothetical protein
MAHSHGEGGCSAGRNDAKLLAADPFIMTKGIGQD